ncbi:MAG: hypothetical protein IJ193_08125 [Bacilli bacterium]|nr:hypothetical protein [Bacilli bacterium]
MESNINFETNNNGFDLPKFDYNIPASPIKINKLINEFKVGEREMTSITYLPVEMNIRISEGILKNPDFIIECKYFGIEQRKVIVVNKYDPLYSTIRQIFIDDKTPLYKEVK